MKKIFIILLIFIFILSINLSFADNSTDVLTESADDGEFLGDSSDIYVSNEGSDSLGDGSLDKPYRTLNHTGSIASENSNIHLKSGVYTSSVDIDKSISIIGDGDVSIDGSSNQKMFKVSRNSSLKLNNINFINGYCDLEGDILSPIVNDGNLVILNSTFYNFTTIMGAVKNLNTLTIDNVDTRNLNLLTLSDNVHVTYTSPYGEFVTNVGECRILNSNILSSIHNNANLSIYDSYIDVFRAGKDYMECNITTVADKSC